ncbi:hypothetical protein MRX96_055268 [Rhipicephalus microplus]
MLVSAVPSDDGVSWKLVKDDVYRRAGGGVSAVTAAREDDEDNDSARRTRKFASGQGEEDNCRSGYTTSLPRSASRTSHVVSPTRNACRDTWLINVPADGSDDCNKGCSLGEVPWR